METQYLNPKPKQSKRYASTVTVPEEKANIFREVVRGRERERDTYELAIRLMKEPISLNLLKPDNLERAVSLLRAIQLDSSSSFKPVTEDSAKPGQPSEVSA